MIPSYPPKKILITGATGYLGSNLVRRMSEHRMNVRTLVRRTSSISKLSNLKNVEICWGDITDLSSVERVVKDCQAVIHAAALVSDWGDYRKFYEVNFLGTKNILIASVKEGIEKFLYISTIDVLNLSGKGIIREDHPYGRLKASYSRSKAEAEKLVRKYSHSIPTVIIRPPAVYGPEDPLLTAKALSYAHKRMLFVVGRGRGIFPHVYIDNLVEAILLAFQKEEAVGEIFNITDGVNTSVCEFFNHLNTIAGNGIIHLSFPYAVALCGAFFMDFFARITKIPPLLSWTALKFLYLKCQFDISKAREILGYKPSISLEEGMRRVKVWWESKNADRNDDRKRITLKG